MLTVFVPLALALGAAAGAAWVVRRAAARTIEATILFIGPIYGPSAGKVQSRFEKSTAETAVARLRLDTPSRIGIAKRVSARSSRASLRP